ncbi:hypothetical protein GTW43_35100 [Streptomyces sp. SID5785]|uniref:hypothetical protein n=1 Tax=Streptomyces sp. SID5785 TaxID=2690309 RepID=UPI001361BF18|nr:hypothetical protein [Streptomyces sp. SID5785]MZD10267.1 hypothetical protein [Streptomyces sp. SID5785]
MTSEPTPDWVPRTGLQLRLAGVHFDAIRLRGVRGEAVLHHLVTLTDGDPGPVVREVAGGRWTYFLLAPGESRDFDWPPGATCFGPVARDQYVGVPAASGNTYPLSWRCGPPRVGAFVDAELLHGVVTAQLTPDPEDNRPHGS